MPALLSAGGTRQGAYVAPTWLEGVPHDAPVSCQEVFGPVATLEPFTDFKAACQVVDRSDFGLQAAVEPDEA